MALSQMLLVRLRRLLAAASGPLAFALLTLAATIVGITIQGSGASSPQSITSLTPYLVSGVALGALFWFLQAVSEYRRRTFDPTWALKYDVRWVKATEVRRNAAHAIFEGRRNGTLAKIETHSVSLAPIDDALDLLEDIGFFVAGDQMSPEVAHHYFFHWIRGYWNAANDYINTRQRSQPALWGHFGLLVDLTAQVEAEQTPSGQKHRLITLTDDEIVEFLDEETRGPGH
jgi:hypothetical protein